MASGVSVPTIMRSRSSGLIPALLSAILPASAAMYAGVSLSEEICL